MLENHVLMAFKILPRDSYLMQDENIVATRMRVLLFAIGDRGFRSFWRIRNRFHKTRFINTQKLRKPVPTSVSKPKLSQCELPKLI